MYMLRNKRVWVAGETGMVGQAIVRQLQDYDCTVLSALHASLDLRDQTASREWINDNRPDAIFLAAATVGGIEANRRRPADFLYDNMMIAANVIHAAAEAKVEKLLYLGSSCIYPRNTAQPITEDALMTGALEKTNEGYALAKIAGVKMCQFYREQYGCNFISAMPCNLYGPGDRFDAVNSHVIPALIFKIHEAKEWQMPELTLWGTGAPMREFLHVDDLARGLMVLMQNYKDSRPVNIGSSEETTIAALANMIAGYIQYTGHISFDSTMPDGTPRKVLDGRTIRSMGWAPRISLSAGLKDVIADYTQGMEIKLAA